jgi:DNA processing protein
VIKLNIEDELYPKSLKNVDKPPKQLYLEGNIELLKTEGFAVIGSRSHSEYGEKMCQKFVKELVESRMTIISGMAKGIDSIAHKTCLENGGQTIAVLPCGFNKIFPKENQGLYKDILNLGGTVISEYAPNEEAEYHRFLDRNRIVAGLGIGTLVVEAGYRSGTSVTARLTMEQGKNVFCIPSSLENRNGITSNEIIQRGGKLVICIEDILQEYPELDLINVRNSYKKDKRKADKYKQMKVDEEYLDVYNVLTESPMDINEIIRKSGLSISEVNYKLMMLEINNYVVQLSGKRFIKK